MLRGWLELQSNKLRCCIHLDGDRNDNLLKHLLAIPITLMLRLWSLNTLTQGVKAQCWSKISFNIFIVQKSVVWNPVNLDGMALGCTDHRSYLSKPKSRNISSFAHEIAILLCTVHTCVRIPLQDNRTSTLWQILCENNSLLGLRFEPTIFVHVSSCQDMTFRPGLFTSPVNHFALFGSQQTEDLSGVTKISAVLTGNIAQWLYIQ